MTQNPTVYRINRRHRLLRSLKDNTAIIKYILASNPLKKQSVTEILDRLTTYETEQHKYSLFVDNGHEAESDWKDFLPEDLTIDRDFSQQLLSLVLFVETSIDLLVIVGGSAFRIILPYIDESYGLNTYSRIMTRDQDELISIRSRGITGNRVGMNEQFRKDFRIMDFIRFGKFPVEIQLRLSRTTTDTHFSYLKTKANERVQITVSKGFKVKKAIDFDALDDLVSELNYIQELAPSDYLSSYEEVTDSGFIRDQLYPLLIQQLYNDIPYINRTVDEYQPHFEFDFCDPNNIEKFYEADYYILKAKTDDGGHKQFGRAEHKDEIYLKVMRHALTQVGENDKFSLMVFLQGVRVTCYHNNKKSVGSAFLYHFNAEFHLDQTPYFLIDTKWFKLRATFVNELQTDALHIFRANKTPKTILDLPWDKKILATERDYNLSYQGRAGYIVMDTFTPDGIELCDLIHYDKDNIYLIHVKYGFGGQIRELTNQIILSARRLKFDLASKEKKWLEEAHALAERAGHVQGLSFEDFKSLFVTKKVNYVLAFCSHLKDDFLVEDQIERFKSNIARFSLIECSSDMRQSYFELYVAQISRNSPG
ncbi:DUF6119 family protein [Pedobacter roseus]|uniref:TIGR04141 family sporadically distributed protein n=1 Tax=Pedobacter roseus TaxID=336820 RepID=A0A7G9QGZ1_9SPHI|nr:DUF6119 family protein [Pedobacter roseus]QNN42616.1 TIGR04141 family sporadically distributed protein [Pedobacter roseus]